MPSLSDIGTIKDIMQRHGFSFSKGLGQNFLVNPSVCPRMAELGGANEKAGVLENFGNVKVIHGDALRLDLAGIIRDSFSDCDNVAVCANLPYYITSPIIMALLESRLPISSVTVMVQKEAADRICAKIGSRESGALTVAIHYYSEPRMLFRVSPGSFMPPPKVTSAVIRMDILPAPKYDVGDEKTFFAMVKAGFSQRRKTLCNALTSGGFLTKEQAAQAIADASIAPTARIEALDMDALATLSRSICQIKI